MYGLGYGLTLSSSHATCYRAAESLKTVPPLRSVCVCVCTELLNWTTAGETITQTPVGCSHWQSNHCDIWERMSENELLNILRLDCLIPKWIPQGDNRDRTNICALYLHCLLLPITGHSRFFNVPHVITDLTGLQRQGLFSSNTPYSGGTESIILCFGFPL